MKLYLFKSSVMTIIFNLIRYIKCKLQNKQTERRNVYGRIRQKAVIVWGKKKLV